MPDGRRKRDPSGEAFWSDLSGWTRPCRAKAVLGSAWVTRPSLCNLLRPQVACLYVLHSVTLFYCVCLVPAASHHLVRKGLRVPHLHEPPTGGGV